MNEDTTTTTSVDDTTTTTPPGSPVGAVKTSAPTTYVAADTIPPTYTIQWTPKNSDATNFGQCAVCLPDDPKAQGFVIALDTKKNRAHAEDVANREGWTVVNLPVSRLVEVAAKKTPVNTYTPDQLAFFRAARAADPAGFAAAFPDAALALDAADEAADDAEA